jgi:hypothetical protein
MRDGLQEEEVRWMGGVRFFLEFREEGLIRGWDEERGKGGKG